MDLGNHRQSYKKIVRQIANLIRFKKSVKKQTKFIKKRVVMKSLQKFLLSGVIFTCTAPYFIESSFWGSSSSNATSSSDDYEQRISDLEDAMITISKNMSALQSQITALQKQSSTTNDNYGSGFNYNSKNNFQPAPPKKILTTEEQIINLQEQNFNLQKDTANRQKQMTTLNNSQNFNPTALTQKRSIYQAAITKNNAQINFNNNKIATLQESAANASPQTRSTLLGRLSSSVTSQAKALKNKFWK